MKKTIQILSVLITAAVTGVTGFSADANFNGANNAELMDHLSRVPLATDPIVVKDGLTANVSKTQEIYQLRAGISSSAGTIYMTGGTTTVNRTEGNAIWLGTAGASAPKGSFYMSGGSLNVSGGGITIAAAGSATTTASALLGVTGGSITVADNITIANAATNSASNGTMEISNAFVSTKGFIVGSGNTVAAGSFAKLTIHHDANVSSAGNTAGLNIRKSGTLSLVVGDGESTFFNAVDFSQSTNSIVVSVGAKLEIDLSNLSWVMADPTDSITLNLIDYTGGTKGSIENFDLSLTGAGVTNVTDVAGSDWTYLFTKNGEEYAAQFTFGADALSLTIMDASAIPEPSTYAALMALAALVFVMHRRRKV